MPTFNLGTFDLHSVSTTKGEPSSKFDEFVAVRSQSDSDHDQIWQACADRSGNGSYLNIFFYWPHEWPGRVGSLGPSFEARQDTLLNCK